jgi:hypothetical protein
MSYDMRHYWMRRRSRPCRSHPVLYGCGCGVVRKSNCLTTSVETRFSWLPLSIIKCSEVPFTHICEWKRCSPSSESSSSSGWIVAVVTMIVSSASIIRLLLLLFESESELGIDSVSLSSATNDCFE